MVLADGSHRDIEDVQVGDEILATDPETGETSAQPVLGTITTKGDKNLVQITVTTDASDLPWPAETEPKRAQSKLHAVKHSKNGVLIATDNHPFWVAGDISKWVEAADLKPGMWLRTSVGTYVQVTAAEHRTTHSQRVHDLTIAKLHTYYVLAGETSVLVHNCNGNLADLPIHEKPTRFYAKASEMLDRIPGNPTTREQMYGSADAGHGGVTSLSNESLTRFGGPNGREPITGYREFALGDDINLPGSRLYIIDGNNRTEEIRNRVLDGRMHPETLIEILIGGS